MFGWFTKKEEPAVVVIPPKPKLTPMAVMAPRDRVVVHGRYASYLEHLTARLEKLDGEKLNRMTIKLCEWIREEERKHETLVSK
jgi:hypothetical protein